jgi:hypothetical protein
MIYCDDHPMLRYVQNLQCYQFPSKYTLQDALLLSYAHCHTSASLSHHALARVALADFVCLHTLLTTRADLQ